jgi:guanylate kinase
MIVLVGASASGKTELAKILGNSYQYKKCITTTTRMMRKNEEQDVDYHFMSKLDFLNKHANGDFIEVTYYQENLYGIQKNDVTLNGVVIVDPTGANSLIDQMAQDVYIVLVESREELRRSRMIKRGDDLQVIENRILMDTQIFQPEMINRVDLLVKNESDTLRDLAAVIHQHYQSHMKHKNEEVS